MQRFSSRVDPKFNRRHQSDSEGVCTKAIMTTANNQTNNLSPWQPGQSGNPSGRPKGTRDLAGYVLETTDAGRELKDSLLSIARRAIKKLPTHSLRLWNKVRICRQTCGDRQVDRRRVNKNSCGSAILSGTLSSRMGREGTTPLESVPRHH